MSAKFTVIANCVGGSMAAPSWLVADADERKAYRL
jgi:hypothetical protein